MPVQIDTPEINPFSLQGEDFLRVTVAQLRAWEIAVSRQMVIAPVNDDQALEGTEIDPRRTVL